MQPLRNRDDYCIDILEEYSRLWLCSGLSVSLCCAARICTKDDGQAASVCPAVRVCYVTVKQFDIKTSPVSLDCGARVAGVY
jgi:hypothetical protein